MSVAQATRTTVTSTLIQAASPLQTPAIIRSSGRRNRRLVWLSSCGVGLVKPAVSTPDGSIVPNDSRMEEMSSLGTTSLPGASRASHFSPIARSKSSSRSSRSGSPFSLIRAVSSQASIAATPSLSTLCARPPRFTISTRLMVWLTVLRGCLQVRATSRAAGPDVLGRRRKRVVLTRRTALRLLPLVLEHPVATQLPEEGVQRSLPRCEMRALQPVEDLRCVERCGRQHLKHGELEEPALQVPCLSRPRNGSGSTTMPPRRAALS